MTKILYDLGYHTGLITSYFLKDIECHIPDLPDVFREDNEGSVIYAFEPNTDLMQYSMLDFDENNIQMSNKLVWTEDGEKTFYTGHPRRTQGFSVFYKEGKHTGSVEKETIDFSKFLKETVTPGARIVVKMDIEGAEYPVLIKMIEDETICLIDDLIVEFHGSRSLGSKFGIEMQPSWLYLRDWFAKADCFKTKTLWRLYQ